MLNKIKNNTFFKSTIILLIGGIFGKLVGFILKIIVTRNLGTHGMGLYSMLSGITSLLTVISVFSYSNAVSKAISENSSNPKSLLISLLPVSFIINILIIIIVILFSKTLSTDLLKESSLYYPIICISLTMPFISVSSIIKGYFWGKQNMMPYMISNFIEQIIRFIFIVLFINKFLEKSIIHAICYIIIVNIIGEIFSQIVMIKYFPKFKIKLSDFKINIRDLKNIYSFSIPVTFSKIIGSISYFLEPIILTNILLYVGYTKDYIVYEYGIVNAYALSTLLMPQFFTQNMATSLIPELSKHYKLKNYNLCKRRIKQIILISLFIGSLSTIIITLFPKFFLNILYKTQEGIDYIKLLSPFTLLFYIEYPLINALQAIGASKETFLITIKTSIIRLLCIIILSLFKIGMYSLIISIIINLILSTILYYKKLNKLLTV